MASDALGSVSTVTRLPARASSRAQFQPAPGSEPVPGEQAYAERMMFTKIT
jgi:hypothetical protein